VPPDRVSLTWIFADGENVKCWWGWDLGGLGRDVLSAPDFPMRSKTAAFGPDLN
jgi:hypothetical protein